jgi:hypothetical protein
MCTLQKSDVLCFQVLLSFVPTIFHFLYGLAFSAPPGRSLSLLRLSSRGACLRQTVHKKTIVIGYHTHLGLSSGK